jgi:hypothetical protein
VDHAPTTELLQRLIEIMKQSQGRRLSKPRVTKVKPIAITGRPLGKLATS